MLSSFSGITFVFVLLCFRLYAFVEAAALRSIFLRYAGAPIATPRVSFPFLFPFIYLKMSLFPGIFVVPYSGFSLFGEYVVRSFLPDSVFLSIECNIINTL